MKLCLTCGARFEGDTWRCPGCGAVPKRLHGHLAFSPELAEANEGFRADYFPELARLEAGHFWFESRNRLIVWALRRYFPTARRFLEIGCGTGFVLSGIRAGCPELALSGSEVLSQGLAVAERRVPDASLFQLDARLIPFQDEFDVIGAFDVLEHIEEDEVVLSQMFRAAKHGGGILLTVPQHPFLWSAADDYALHKRRYRMKGLIEKVARAGFSPLRITSFVSLLLPLMALARVTQRASRGAYDPSAEFRIAGITNAVLSIVSSIERNLIKGGVSFPAGGSLLMIATKP